MYTIEEFDKQKSKVMNYIMYKKRSEYEVKNKFSGIIEEDMLCDIIDYVKEAGYLSDYNYIERSIEEFKALKNMSLKEIEYKLQQKGIKRNDIEDYKSLHYDELKEYEIRSAKNIFIKREMSMEKDEIKTYLMKKGYKEDTIKEVFN